MPAATGNYRIASSLSNVYADATPLTTDPHPTEYSPGKLAGYAGNGVPIYVGFASAVWNFTSLESDEMDVFWTLLGGATSALVYIRTRVNDSASGAFVYKYFSGRLIQPEYEAAPYFRYRSCKIAIRHLIAQSDPP